MKKILILEDEEINRHIFQEHLEKNYDVSFVIEGDNVKPWLLNNPLPDLIILDIMVPGINGYEVCEQVIRSNPKYDHIPVVFVSAKASITEQEEGFRVGGNDYLPKPYNEEQLVVMIEKQFLITGLKDTMKRIKKP